MNDSTNVTNKNESVDQKKKQKPGLNAVRPSDYIEGTFKEMAKDMNISQTDMFNRIFWSYLNDQRSERKELALNIQSEIDLISKDLSNILNHFKAIAEKAQDTIISVKTNAEQTEKNINLDKDTLSKRVEELSKRNEELEKLNSVFDEVKLTLESKIQVLTESLKDKDLKLKDVAELNKTKATEILELVNSNKNLEKEVAKSHKEIERLSGELINSNDRLKNVEVELKESKETIKENLKRIKEFDNQVTTLDSANGRFEKELLRIKDEIISKESTIKSLEQSNTSLNNTINTLDKLKKSEIDSIESKYKLQITGLEEKLKSFQENRDKDFQHLRDSLNTENEAEKKLAIAEIKLELADVKSKYAEALTRLNAVKASKDKKQN